MYSSPPLPFQGNKRYWGKYFRKLIPTLPDSFVYVDMFGGSGLLSHWIKHLLPNATVIFNDYDGYSDRLEQIEETNKQREKIKKIIGNDNDKKTISKDIKNKIVDYLKTLPETADFITLSSGLLFARGCVRACACADDIAKGNFYNRMPKNKIKPADDYLNGLIIMHEDYKKLYNTIKEHYKDKNICWIMDPPYLYSDREAYKNKRYWTLKDSLQIIEIMINEPYYLMFNGIKSGLLDVIEMFNKYFIKPLDYLTIVKFSNGVYIQTDNNNKEDKEKFKINIQQFEQSKRSGQTLEYLFISSQLIEETKIKETE